MNVTSWFRCRQRPVHQGWYEVLVGLKDHAFEEHAIERLLWTGAGWLFPDGDVDELTPDMAWRGLAA